MLTRPSVFLIGQKTQDEELVKIPKLRAEQVKADTSGTVVKAQQARPLITFVELGSVNCIPCKKMQPVMKSIEEKYAGQVEVIFYDVWQADQKKYAKQYNIISIPTQVFLDSAGTEISRHIGFYPEKEINKFLQSRGLKPIQKNG